MDLEKTGRYIASKRKALGMTQRTLADKLGMSDKSVSKWERGVCLPDVSTYIELCGILGITINEFLAGEDIESDDIEKVSDENIIALSRQESKKRRGLRKIIIILAAAAVLLVAALLIILLPEDDYIAACAADSPEKQAARAISDVGSTVNLFSYKAGGCSRAALYVCELNNGEPTGERRLLCEISGDDAESGGIAFLYTPQDGIRWSCAGSSSSLPVPAGEFMAAASYSAKKKIVPGEETAVYALLLDSDRCAAPDDPSVLTDPERSADYADIDHIYYFTIEFCK